MQPVLDFLRRDWNATREALHQQIATVESGVLRPALTTDQEQEVIRLLGIALAQYDALLREAWGIDPERQ